MGSLEHLQAIRIVIATIGNQDPISPRTGKPMAALTLCLEHKPQRVYLIPTAEHLASSSYKNAADTKTAILERLPETLVVEILPIEVSVPADLSKLLPDMERILRTIKNRTQDIPNPQFMVTPTSGMHTMSDALIQLLSLGLLENAEV
jgi:hypothetical protein